ncbi:MAG TPA: substrate-binding domain-containing protein [Solirubrobacteraceae bacterium]|nr:substrate-binding domain-containing protein [Solirubrobacteraceae bacterium]
MNRGFEALASLFGSKPSRRLISHGGTALVVCATALSLAACGSSSSSTTTSSTSGAASNAASTSSTSSSSSGGSSGGQSTAQAAVQQGMQVPAAPVPTASIPNISKLRGKTVYYVPISADVPAFATDAANLKMALGSVGVNLNVCSGNFNPSQFATCFSQAIGAHAGAIISDAIPYQLTLPLIKKASAQGIGVVVTDVDELPGRPEAKNISYIPGSDPQDQLISDWITADSGGKADALLLEATDSPTSSRATGVFAVDQLQKVCPGCKYTVLKFSSSNENQLPSLISSAVLKDPNLNYIDGEFDQYVSFIVQGLQQANATTRVKIVAADSALSGMQDVSGNTPVKAEIVDNEPYIGWMSADEALREMAGAPVIPNYYEPIRLFTSSNIHSVQVSNAAISSGAWFGPPTYQSAYKKLWGAS